jgi:hypothetical protein
LIGFGSLAAVACNGTTVFDHPDPTACPVGHGCPMVGCACGDGSLALDTTCVSGECRPQAEVCAELCAENDGVVGQFTTPDDRVPVPGCETFCTRLQINGCELGCDTLFSECVESSTCDATATSFWGCIVNEAVITCDDNVARVEGCDLNELSLCSE